MNFVHVFFCSCSPAALLECIYTPMHSLNGVHRIHQMVGWLVRLYHKAGGVNYMNKCLVIPSNIRLPNPKSFLAKFCFITLLFTTMEGVFFESVSKSCAVFHDMERSCAKSKFFSWLNFAKLLFCLPQYKEYFSSLYQNICGVDCLYNLWQYQTVILCQIQDSA